VQGGAGDLSVTCDRRTRQEGGQKPECTVQADPLGQEANDGRPRQHVRATRRGEGRLRTLTTNTDLTAREVAPKYKQLWMVEDVFRSMKSLLDTRPIYHKRDETIRGHVSCSSLAPLMRQELEERLARKH
jgi:transposase